MNKRRNFSSSFKSKVAIDAIKGDLTLAEISTKHGIHQSQVTKWKKQAVEGLSSIFSNDPVNTQQKYEKDLKELHSKIGELVVEKDFLLKASAH